MGVWVYNQVIEWDLSIADTPGTAGSVLIGEVPSIQGPGVGLYTSLSTLCSWVPRQCPDYGGGPGGQG